MEKIIGIDLGTFNSCVAIVDAGSPQVIANRGGYKTTPSMVAITESGKRIVGHMAKRQAVTNAENTVYAAKRLIGRKYDSPQVRATRATVPYSIVEGPNGDVRLSLRETLYSIPEVSAMLLQELKLVAEEYLGHEVKKAVVTVPAYFNDNQRQATKDAGTIAGLEIIRIINEPTAAALSYGFGKNIDRTVAVYDLGGGTFDVSILEISSNGVFRVVSTAGDSFLGGEDFDQSIIDWLVEGFRDEHDIDLRRDRMALQRLKDAAEKAKTELSTLEETEINLPFIISMGGNEALHLQRSLTRAELEEMTYDLIDRTIAICEHTLDEAGFDKSEIDDLILVGGMTRMPAVQRAVTDWLGKPPCKGVHPDEVVALGAAIQGAALLGQLDQDEEMVLLDVTPHTLGIMVKGGYIEGLIPLNTAVPTSRAKRFTTVRDGQTTVRILVFQGDEPEAKDNELLGEFELTGLRSAAAGEVEVEVTFEINADGIVSVYAKDLDTGKAQSITVTASSGLSAEELKRMTRAAEDYAVAQKLDEEAKQAKQRAEETIASIERLYPEVESLLAGSDFAKEALERASEIIGEARSAIDRGDLVKMKETIDALDRARRMVLGLLGRSA